MHTLTIDEMPRHSHEITHNANFTVGGTGGAGVSGIPSETSSWGTYGNAHWFTIYSDEKGNSKAHNNLQPYITVYMWKRAA